VENKRGGGGRNKSGCPAKKKEKRGTEVHRQGDKKKEGGEGKKI